MKLSLTLPKAACLRITRSGSAGKESACNEGDLGWTPGLGRSPGEGNGYPLQYSGLETCMDCIVHGVAKSDSTTFTSLSGLDQSFQAESPFRPQLWMVGWAPSQPGVTLQLFSFPQILKVPFYRKGNRGTGREVKAELRPEQAVEFPPKYSS